MLEKPGFLVVLRFGGPGFRRGSLVEVGGHNILQASALGKPVLFGPHMANFKEITSQILGAGGGLQIPDADGLAAVVKELLADPAKRQQYGAKGLALVGKNTGATQRTFEVLESFLNR
ncbi:MAG: hypothetical protein SV239_09130 [Thermodesulfobacteriota bacterium]|jgi:3-deoxy-D-manno-octulosonic-acid transferase|nr:hypothetical protein [Thermodesulfobacteriota bacterium]